MTNWTYYEIMVLVALLSIYRNGFSFPQKPSSISTDYYGNLENIFKISKIHFLKLIREKNDWFTRILEIVKLELNYRQVVEHCKTESCLYRIPDSTSNSKKKRRFKRSLKQMLKSRVADVKKNISNYFNEFNESFLKFMENQSAQPVTSSSSSSSVTTPSLSHTSSTESILQNNQSTLHQITTDVKKADLSTKSVGKTKPFQKNVTPKKDNEDKQYMSDCKGIYTYYCKNSAQCVYIDLLEEAVCKCKKGFTGKRCMDYSLSDSILTLNNHEKKSVILENLTDLEYESLISVIDATARFTVNAVIEEEVQVKQIFESPIPFVKQ